MTAQIPDRCRYRRKLRTVAALKGTFPFNPRQHRLPVMKTSTACARGFHCTFKVEDDELFLAEVYLSLQPAAQALAERGQGPLLFGKLPKRYKVIGMGRNLKTGEIYTDLVSGDFRVGRLREPMFFTGGMVLGYDFIEELSAYMDSRPAYKYRQVHELIFEEGRVVEQQNRSKQMAAYRERLSAEIESRGSKPDRSVMQRWLNEYFTLNYKGDPVW